MEMEAEKVFKEEGSEWTNIGPHDITKYTSESIKSDRKWIGKVGQNLLMVGLECQSRHYELNCVSPKIHVEALTPLQLFL